MRKTFVLAIAAFAFVLVAQVAAALEPSVAWKKEYGDVWSAPAPKPRGMLLLLPIYSPADAMDTDGRLSVLIEDHLCAYAPDGFGFSNIDQVFDFLWALRSRKDWKKQPSDAVVEVLRRFYNATAVFGATYEKAEDKLTLRCWLKEGEKESKANFEVPANDNVEAAHLVVKWIANTVHFDLSEEEKANFSKPLYAESLVTTMDSRLAFQDRSPATEVNSFNWMAKIFQSTDLASKVGAHLYFNKRLSGSKIAPDKIGDTYIVSPETFASEKFAALHLAQSYGLIWHGDTIEGRKAACRYLVRQPTDYRGLKQLDEKAYEGQHRSEYLANLQAWYDHAPESAWRDWYMGDTIHRVAWDYRGGGYINTVSAEGGLYFENLKMLSIEYLQRAEKAAGPLPMIAATQIDNFGSLSDTANMQSAADRCFAHYPFAVDVWHALLHFSRPRWGGSIEKGIDLVNAGLDRGGLDSDFAGKVLTFHFGEILIVQREMPYDVAVKLYFKKYPAAAHQIARSQELYFANGEAKNCAFTAALCMYIGERDMARRAILKNPNAVFEPAKSLYDHTASIFRKWAPRLLIETEQWDTLAKMQSKNSVNDNPWKDASAFNAETPFSVHVFGGPEGKSLTSLARVMQNRKDPYGGKALEAAMEYAEDDYERAIICFAHALIDKGTPDPEKLKATLDAVEKKFSEKKDNEGRRIVAATRALMAHHAGDEAEAQEQLKKLATTAAMHADWVRRETCQAILGSVPDVVHEAPAEASGN